MKSVPVTIFTFVVAGALLSLTFPLLATAQTCASLATLTISADKSAYQVGEAIIGEMVFTNNAGVAASVNFNVSAAKDGQSIINNSYTLETQPGRNVWTIKDAFGTNVLPSAGSWVFSVSASYPLLSCSWSASLNLTAVAAPPLPPPQIQSLIPNSRLSGEQVIIQGSNFTPTGNDVKSGTSVVASNLPSAGGDTVVFTVPDVPPGSYPVLVQNQRGTSNEVSFTVLAPPPVKLLTSLTILPSEYLLGQTVTGSVVLTNPTTKEIKANFSIELYKDSALFWQRQINGLSIPPSLGAAPKVTSFSLDDVFGFKPTIPDNPSFVGNWKLLIKRTDTGPGAAPDDLVSQTFSIKAPIPQPLTLTFSFDPKEYLLGDTLKGQGTVVNPGSLPVKTDFKIELFQETTLKWQREIKGISVPAGTANFTVDDLFGFKVVIPNGVSFIGDWKLKIAQIGTTPPVSVEAGFSINDSKLLVHMAKLSKQNIASLETLGIDVWDVKQSSAVAVITEGQKSQLDALGVRFDAIEPLKNYKDRFPVSDGAYHSYDSLTVALKELAQRCPNIVRVSAIGESWEGRKIWAVKLSDNPDMDETQEQDVLFTGGSHAREWISVEVPYLIADRLCELYQQALSSPSEYILAHSVRNLLDHVQLWFIPLTNPDGLEFSRNTDRFWRKNRRNNGDGTFGVDLNRNWLVAWNPRFETDSPYYPGPQAFSEPETESLRKFAMTRRLKGAISFHSFGQDILFPWAYTLTPSPDETRLDAIGQDLSQYIKLSFSTEYDAKQGSSYAGPVGGTEFDFWHKTFKIPALTIELRPESEWGGGFILPAEQIKPTTEEMLPAVLRYIEHVIYPLGGLVALNAAGYDAQFAGRTLEPAIGMPLRILDGPSGDVYQYFFAGNLFQDDGSGTPSLETWMKQYHNLGFGNFASDGTPLRRDRSEEMTRRGWPIDFPFPSDVPKSILQLVTIETFTQDQSPHACYPWGCAGPIWFTGGKKGELWPYETLMTPINLRGIRVEAIGRKGNAQVLFKGLAYPTHLPGGVGEAKLWAVNGWVSEILGSSEKRIMEKGVLEWGDAKGPQLRLGSRYFLDAKFTPRIGVDADIYGTHIWQQVKLIVEP